MLCKQQVTTGEMLTYGPFPTMQREKYRKNNDTRNIYAMSKDSLAIYREYQYRVDVQGILGNIQRWKLSVGINENIWELMGICGN